MEELAYAMEVEEEEEEKVREDTDHRSLQGDVFYNVLSRLFILDLFAVSLVSKQWRDASLPFLRRRSLSCPPPPWLIVHLQRRYTEKNTTRAFDPLSRAWYSLPELPIDPFPSPVLRVPAEMVASYTTHHRGRGARLHVLFGNELALSAEPFGNTWKRLEPLHYPRTDPVLAVFGSYVVVAGGVSNYDDSPSNNVEMCRYGGPWEECDSMPDDFGWTRSLSVAVSERRMYVVKKQPPRWASWFDPETKRWATVRKLQLPDSAAYLSAVGIVNERLVLAVASGSRGRSIDSIRPTSVRFWAVDEETLEVEEEIGKMPAEMVAGLDDGVYGMRSIGFLSQGPYAYVYNLSQPKEFYLCEFGKESGGGGDWECRWERVAPIEEFPMHRMIVGCSVIGRDDFEQLQQQPLRRS